MKRTLVLMRHAKSSWTTDQPDFRRPLNARGVKDATAAGDILSRYPIGAVRASAATRTRETWQNAVEGGARCTDVQFLDDLYGAWPDRVLDVVRQLPEQVNTAVILGHEPTMSEVLHEVVSRWQFAGGPPDAFPTCTMAFIEFKKPWADLTSGHGRLVRFESPRG